MKVAFLLETALNEYGFTPIGPTGKNAQSGHDDVNDHSASSQFRCDCASSDGTNISGKQFFRHNLLPRADKCICNNSQTHKRPYGQHLTSSSKITMSHFAKFNVIQFLCVQRIETGIRWEKIREREASSRGNH
jgi:hypothetical protein